MKYFESKLAGYIGLAVAILGVVLQAFPIVAPFIPEKDKPLVGEVVTFLGGLKMWLATNPWKAGN